MHIAYYRYLHKFTSKIMLNSQIQYPGCEINRSYRQAINFLGYNLPGHILIYDLENHFLGNVLPDHILTTYFIVNMKDLKAKNLHI